MWLEKVLFRTQRSTKPDDAVGRGTPLSGLMRAVEQFDLNADILPERVPEIGSLKNKLPPDLIGRDDPLLPDTPDRITTFRQEVRELLAGKLIRQGKRP